MNAKTNKLLIYFWLLFVLIVPCEGVHAQSTGEANIVGFVEEFSGEIMVRRRDGKTEEASVLMELYIGDSVSAGESGRAVIRSIGGSYVIVDHNTTLTLHNVQDKGVSRLRALLSAIKTDKLLSEIEQEQGYAVVR